MLNRLLDLLFPPREDEAVLRECGDQEFIELVAPELVFYTDPPTTALLPFADRRVRAAIHEAKYRGSERAFKLLGDILGEYLQEIAAEESFDRIKIIPLPLGAKRRRDRGFNQVEEVAKRAIVGTGLEIESGLLVRTRETSSQISLPKVLRKRNMRGAFGAAGPIDPQYTYIVIDDVVTTGATLSAATLALRSAGARNIIPLALAH